MPITHNSDVYLKKIGNYQPNFYLIAKNNGKKKNRDRLTLECYDFTY